ncbi:hypothetical protein ACSZNK_19995 [Aeromonas hydrophila]
MKKIPSFVWFLIRLTIVVLMLWQIFGYLFSAQEQRLRTDGWPASSQPADSNYK